ncbi:hypothetical protein E2Q23_00475 [Salmonella enterica subsp. enterica serovar Goldcoast]|nr:hypothetical protein [Salmonella enterica subsp. enterica serovar Goldcoast]
MSARSYQTASAGDNCLPSRGWYASPDHGRRQRYRLFAIQQFTHDISPASINFPPPCRFGVKPLPDGRPTGAYVVIVV